MDYGLTLLTHEQHDALFSGYEVDAEVVSVVREIIKEMSPWDAYCYNVTSHCC